MVSPEGFLRGDLMTQSRTANAVISQSSPQEYLSEWRLGVDIFCFNFIHSTVLSVN